MASGVIKKSMDKQVEALEAKTAIDGSGDFISTVSDNTSYYKLSNMYFRPSDNTVRFVANGTWHKFTVTDV